MLKGHNSGKNQLSTTLIKYAHLQVMGTITGKFHQNSLKTVGGVAETKLCLRRDGLTDGQTDEPKTIVPFDLRRGDNDCSKELSTEEYKKLYVYNEMTAETKLCLLSF